MMAKTDFLFKLYPIIMFYRNLISAIGDKNYKQISEDNFLIWHFLYNQEDSGLFSKIKDNLIPHIVWLENENISNQFKLLEYFEKYCFESHSDEIIDILYLLMETDYEPLKRRIAIISKWLKPNSNFEKLYQILLYLISSKELIVKEFAILSSIEFIDNFSEEQLKNLIKESFKPNKPENVENFIWWWTKLIHQWKDLTDWIFRSASKFLWKLLQSPRNVSDFIDFTMERIDEAFDKEEKYLEEYSWEKNIPIKFNYVWWLLDNKKMSDFEYETDSEKKLSYELWNALSILRTNDMNKFFEIRRYLLENWKNLVYFEIINRLLLDDKKTEVHDDFVIMEELIFNQDLRNIIDPTEKRWYKLFQRFFSIESWDISKFENIVMNFKSTLYDDEYNKRIKAKLLFAIPSDKRSTEANDFISKYEEIKSQEYKSSYKLKVNKDDKIELFSWTPWNIDDSWIWDKQTAEQLINRLKDFIKNQRKFDSEMEMSDLGKVYGLYFKNYPDDLEWFYKETEKQEIELKWWFVWNMTAEYINYIKETSQEKELFYDKMINLYNLIPDRWSKINIWRALSENNYLREKDTGDLSPEIYEKIKKMVIDMSKDRDPEEDKNTFLHLWLNSVRWIWTALLCILAFYYPKDEDLENRILELSDDPCIWIRAYLITNLVYLIPDSKNYPLCQKIIDKFKEDTNPSIELAIIRYMFRLWNEKLENNLDLLENIMIRTKDKDVLNDAGSLIWQAFLHQVNVKDIFDKILNNKLWTPEILERIAFQFQRVLWKQLLLSWIAEPVKIEMLEYYKKLLSYKEEDEETKWAVANRASFLFADDDMTTGLFEVFKKNSIFDKVIETKQLDVIHNLNEYLLRCTEDEKYLDDILDILDKEVVDVNAILTDDWFASRIWDIMLKIYSDYDWKNNSKAEKIFDEWLKYWTWKFYEIFNKRYKD